MSLAPFGGTRRGSIVLRIGSLLSNPSAIAVDVALDGSIAANATMSAEATANIANVAPGVYAFSYSAAHLAAGTSIREIVKVKTSPSGSWIVVGTRQLVVEAVVTGVSNLAASDQVSLRLNRSC